MRSGRRNIVLMMLAALILAALTRTWSEHAHASLSRGLAGTQADAGEQSLQAFPSYATALLLGGLRGPLIMMLWTTSESQKIEHNLQDFDTKIEWIRILQPEFDTVHLFQIWNKAYNVSVMMSSTANKYSTILDALDYAHKVDAQKPDDLNILSQMAGVYADKLGSSGEMLFYRRQIRRQTQARVRLTMPMDQVDRFKELAAKRDWLDTDEPLNLDPAAGIATVTVEQSMANDLQRQFTGAGIIYEPLPPQIGKVASGKRVRLDQVLDAHGNILPEYLQPKPGLEHQGYDGSALQCIAKYQPFPYGLSPFAFGYNYYARSQLLYRLWGEHSIQTGDLVVDSRPGLTLKQWAIDEWERGRRAEIAYWGLQPKFRRLDLEPVAADTPMDAPVADAPSADLALYSYHMAGLLMDDAKAAMLDHVSDKYGFARDLGTYSSHMDEITAASLMLHADEDYLSAVMRPADRRLLLQKARAGYEKSRRAYAMLILKYYTEDPLIAAVYPSDPKTHAQYQRMDISSLDPGFSTDLYVQVFQKSQDLRHKGTFLSQLGARVAEINQFHDEREENMLVYDRIEARLKVIESQASTAPANESVLENDDNQ